MHHSFRLFQLMVVLVYSTRRKVFDHCFNSQPTCIFVLVFIGGNYNPRTCFSSRERHRLLFPTFELVLLSQWAQGAPRSFERHHNGLAIWQPSPLQWSTSPMCHCSVFFIHIWECPCSSTLVLCDLILSALFLSHGSLGFLAELSNTFLMGCLFDFQQSWALWPTTL